MTYKIRVVYSIEGTVCTDEFTTSGSKPAIEIHPGTRTAIVNLESDNRIYIYGDVWKVERLSE